MIIPKAILIGMGAVVGTGLMMTACPESPNLCYSNPYMRSRLRPLSVPAPLPALVSIAAKGSKLKSLDLKAPPDLIVFDPGADRFYLKAPCGGCGMG